MEVGGYEAFNRWNFGGLGRNAVGNSVLHNPRENNFRLGAHLEDDAKIMSELMSEDEVELFVYNQNTGEQNLASASYFRMKVLIQ